jgi:ATP-dependent helicase/nuclease subunit A
LYVAFTRARDTLVLSTTVAKKQWETTWTTPALEPNPIMKIARARSYADWLALWFARNVPAQNATEGETALLSWRFVNDVATGENPAQAQDLKSCAAVELDDATADRLRGILDWKYPHEPATKRKAKSSVTELRRTAEELDDEAEQVFARPLRKPRKTSTTLTAAETGNAHHKFLEHVSLDATADIAAEADRLARENFLTPEERAVLDLPALVAFWNSELGKKIRAQAVDVRRELPFTARFRPEAIAPIIGDKAAAAIGDEFIVVQGVADLIVLLREEIWLVDFKTDDVRASDLADKIKLYQPQLQLYALALEQIFSRPVKLKALHFLSLKETRQL